MQLLRVGSPWATGRTRSINTWDRLTPGWPALAHHLAIFERSRMLVRRAQRAYDHANAIIFGEPLSDIERELVTDMAASMDRGGVREVTRVAAEAARWYAAEEDAKRWRARCPVNAADVEAVGVTAEQCEAFLLANGGRRNADFCIVSPSKELASESRWHVVWMEGTADVCVAEACNNYARSSGVPAQDVLEAMQRAEVG